MLTSVFEGSPRSCGELLGRYAGSPYCGLRALLLLALLLQPVNGVCPHCFGNFASCTWDADAKCPTVVVVSSNAQIISGAATGMLALSAIVKSKFLRVFSKTSLASILTLVNRPEPGAPFEISATTKGSAIMAAISYGQISMEAALFQLSDLMEAAADDSERLIFKGRIASLKVLQPKVDAEAGGKDVVGLGIFTFIWAKVSEYVKRTTCVDKVTLDLRDAASPSASSGSFTKAPARGVRGGRHARRRGVQLYSA